MSDRWLAPPPVLPAAQCCHLRHALRWLQRREPCCRWGFLRGHPGLRGMHGFESRRLPGSGALGPGRQLAAAAAERLATTPWIPPGDYDDPVANVVLAQAGHLIDPGLGSCSLDGSGTGQGDGEGETCGADGGGGPWAEDNDAGPPPSHLANAIAALTLVLAPLAGRASHWAAAVPWLPCGLPWMPGGFAARSKRCAVPAAAVWQAGRLYARRRQRLQEEARRDRTRQHAAHGHRHPQRRKPAARTRAGGATATSQSGAGGNGKAALQRPASAGSAITLAEPAPKATSAAGDAGVPTPQANLLQPLSPPPEAAADAGSCAAVEALAPAAADTGRAMDGLEGVGTPQPDPADVAAAAAAECLVAAAAPAPPLVVPPPPERPPTAAPPAPASPPASDLAAALPSLGEVLAAMLPAESPAKQQPAAAVTALATPREAGGRRGGAAGRQGEAALPPQTPRPYRPPLVPGASPAGSLAGGAGASLPSMPAVPLPATPTRPRPQRGARALPPLPPVPTEPAHCPPPPAAALPISTAAPTVATAGASTSASSGPDNECVVCWEAERGTVLIPCGHLGLCRACANSLMASPQPECPVCRAPVAFAQPFFAA